MRKREGGREEWKGGKGCMNDTGATSKRGNIGTNVLHKNC